MIIRDINNKDIEQITNIYNHYVKSTAISFEEQPVTVDTMKERTKRVSAAKLPWIIAESEQQVFGYAYATQWKSRSAYRFTVELSIYLCPTKTTKGMGTALYTELLRRLKDQGFKNAIGVVALPNPASIGLHEKLGFKKVGELPNIGVKFGENHSVGYWQLELESL